MVDLSPNGFMDMTFRAPGDSAVGKGPTSEQEQVGLANNVM